MAKCKVLTNMLSEYENKYNINKEDFVPPFKKEIGLELFFMPYEDSLNFKGEYIKNLFLNKEINLDEINEKNNIYNNFSKETLNNIKVYPSPVINGYRNKMEYSFGDTKFGDPLNLGLHVPGKYYDIKSTHNLSIVDEDFNTIVKEIEAYVRKKGYHKFYKKNGTGLLRNLIIRKGYFSKEILIGISTNYDTKEEIFDEEDFVNTILSIDLNGKIVGILRLKNNFKGDVVSKGKDDKLLYGRDFYIENILGLKFKISFFSFFQTNSPCCEVLYSRIVEIIKNIIEADNNQKEKIIYDLFCGTGTISQVLGSKIKDNNIKFKGVEIIEDAVIMAKENAKENNIENATYIADDVFNVFNANTPKPYLIILDPPRSGILEKTIKKIADLQSENILYVSCNPRTLAIDLSIFKEYNYKITHIEAVDMYPVTKHVETIALIQKVKK